MIRGNVGGIVRVKITDDADFSRGHALKVDRLCADVNAIGDALVTVGPMLPAWMTTHGQTRGTPRSFGVGVRSPDTVALSRNRILSLFSTD